MNEYLDIVVRSLISLAVLIICCRLVGARQISQLTFYDYVVGITIGSIAGTLCVDRDINLWYSVIAIVIFSLISIFLAWITGKSIIMRRMLTGSAQILIDNGNFIKKNLKHAKFDVNDVLRELRVQGYFSVSEIRYAILESNGQLSVMPYAKDKPATNSDLNNRVEESSMESNVIIDGKIMKRNLSATGYSVDWLKKEVEKQGEKIKNILLATLTTDGTLSLFDQNESCHHNTVLM